MYSNCVNEIWEIYMKMIDQELGNATCNRKISTKVQTVWTICNLVEKLAEIPNFLGNANFTDIKKLQLKVQTLVIL